MQLPPMPPHEIARILAGDVIDAKNRFQPVSEAIKTGDNLAHTLVPQMGPGGMNFGGGGSPFAAKPRIGTPEWAAMYAAQAGLPGPQYLKPVDKGNVRTLRLDEQLGAKPTYDYGNQSGLSAKQLAQAIRNETYPNPMSPYEGVKDPSGYTIGGPLGFKRVQNEVSQNRGNWQERLQGVRDARSARSGFMPRVEQFDFGGFGIWNPKANDWMRGPNGNQLRFKSAEEAQTTFGQMFPDFP